MGFFDKLFGGDATNESQDKTTIPWVALTTIAQLKTITEHSNHKVQAIFKHSTRCGISRTVIKNFEKNYDLNADQIDIYYLDLLNHRDISAQIAEQFQVLHESPQFIVIKNEKTVHHASHSEITPSVVHEFLS